jgi:hypothetical protein
MAYTDKTITNAFNKDETHPNGFDFISADELFRRLCESALGRFYIDESGNVTYESRHHREA